MLGITLTLPALLLPSAPLRAPVAPLRAPTPTMGVGRAVADAAREKYYWLAPWEKMPDPMRKFGRPTTLDLRFAIQPFNRTGAVLATVFVTQEGLAPPEPNKYEGLWNIGSLAARTEGDLAVALANQRTLIEAWAGERVRAYTTGEKLVRPGAPLRVFYATKPKMMQKLADCLVEVAADAPTDEAVDCGFHGDRCVCVRGANGGGFRFDEVNLPEYGI